MFLTLGIVTKFMHTETTTTDIPIKTSGTLTKEKGTHLELYA